MTKEMFDYFGALFGNSHTKYLGYHSNLPDFRQYLKSMEVSEREGLKDYKTLFCVVKYKESVNGTVSFVLHVQERVISAYNAHSNWVKQFVTALKIDFCEFKFENTFVPMCMHEDDHSAYTENAEFLCLVHWWIFTMEEWLDNPNIMASWQDKICINNIERWRLLFLVLAVSGDPNFLLYK